MATDIIYKLSGMPGDTNALEAITEILRLRGRVTELQQSHTNMVEQRRKADTELVTFQRSCAALTRALGQAPPGEPIHPSTPGGPMTITASATEIAFVLKETLQFLKDAMPPTSEGALINQRLDQLERTLMNELEKLKAAVERDTTVTQSAVTLLQGLSQQIKDAAGDKAKLQAITDSLDGNTNALAAAVVANTPQADPVTA